MLTPGAALLTRGSSPLICATLLHCVVFLTMCAFAANALHIPHQDGFGNSRSSRWSGTQSRPLRDATIMQLIGSWPLVPGLHIGDLAFVTAVANDTNPHVLWLIPYNSEMLVQLDTRDGTMRERIGWPNPVSQLSLGDAAFIGGIVVGRHLWLIPCKSQLLVRMDTDTMTMEGYGQWPTGVRVSHEWGGAAYDRRTATLWLVPYNGKSVLSMNATSGAMTKHSNWPTNFPANLADNATQYYSLGDGAFRGCLVDGADYMWLVPYNSNALVRLDPQTGNMTQFLMPSDGGTGSRKFAGGAFDGVSYLWLAPHDALYVARVNVSDGQVTAYMAWPQGVNDDVYTARGKGAFAGAVYDGRYVWLVPSNSAMLVRVDAHLGNTTNMTGFVDFPFPGLSLGNDAFHGGWFDGAVLWLVPSNARGVLRLGAGDGRVSDSASASMSLPQATHTGRTRTVSPSVALSPSETLPASPTGTHRRTPSVSMALPSSSVTLSPSPTVTKRTTPSRSSTESFTRHSCTIRSTNSPAATTATSSLSNDTSGTASLSHDASVSPGPQCNFSNVPLHSAVVGSVDDPTVDWPPSLLLADGATSVLMVEPKLVTNDGSLPPPADARTAQQLARAAVEQHPQLAVRLVVYRQHPLSKPWSVVSVRWRADDDVSSDGINLTFASIEGLRSLDDVDPLYAWHYFLVIRPPPPSAPSSGWLPVGMGLFRSTEFFLFIEAACDNYTSPSSALGDPIRIRVPVAAAPSTVAQQVVASSARAVQWVSAVSGPGSGSAVGRVTAIRSVVLCSKDDAASGGLLGWKLRLGCEATGTSSSRFFNDDDVLDYARGAIVGNVAVLLVGTLTVLMALSALYAGVVLGRRRQEGGGGCLRRLTAAMFRFALPSSLLPIWIVVLPTTTSATVVVLLTAAGGEGCWADAAMAAVGVVSVLAPWALLLLLPRWAHRTVARVPRVRCASDTDPKLQRRRRWQVSLPACLRRLVDLADRRRWRWVPATDTGAPDSKQQQTGEELSPTTLAAARGHAGRTKLLQSSRVGHVVLEEFDVVWYPALDSAVLICAAVLAAISGLGGIAQCYASAGTLVALYTAQLCVCVLTRPFSTTLSQIHGAMCLACAAMSALLQSLHLAYASTATTTPHDWMRDAAASFDLAVVGVTAVRVATDAVALVGVGRRIAVEWKASSQATAPRTSAIALMATDNTEPPTSEPPKDRMGCRGEEGVDVPMAMLQTTTEEVVVAPHDDGAATTILLATSTRAACEVQFWDANGNAVVVKQRRASEGGGLSPTDSEDDIGEPPLLLSVNTGSHAQQDRGPDGSDLELDEDL